MTQFDFPEPFEDRNLLSASAALSEAVHREGASSALKRLSGFALMIGSSGTLEQARRANQNAPQLEAFDQSGKVLNRVVYHPAYLDLIERAAVEGLKCPPVVVQSMPTVRQAAYVERAAQIYLSAGADGGHVRALTMANAGLSLLEQAPALSDTFSAKVQARGWDIDSAPIEGKAAASLAVALAVPQFEGALTVSANSDISATVSGLIRHVWMPDADAVLALARIGTGTVTAFVPRYRQDGSLNALTIRPLIATAGLKSAAYADVFCDQAEAIVIRSPEGLANALLHQRLDGATAIAGIMHRALAEAISFSRFGDQRDLGHRTLVQHTLASMALDVEAALALTFRLARAFDRAPDARAAAWRRLMTPVTAYVVSKLAAAVLAELSDVMGPMGVSEHSPLPRLVRDGAATLWFDHSSTDLTLDVLRMLQRDPDVMATVLGDLREASLNDEQLQGQFQRVESLLHEPRYLDGRGRMLLEDLGLLASAVLLKSHAPPLIGSAFATLRLGHSSRRFYGQGLDWADHDAILARIAVVD